jgi:hypothetical protein
LELKTKSRSSYGAGFLYYAFGKKGVALDLQKYPASRYPSCEAFG